MSLWEAFLKNRSIACCVALREAQSAKNSESMPFSSWAGAMCQTICNHADCVVRKIVRIAVCLIVLCLNEKAKNEGFFVDILILFQLNLLLSIDVCMHTRTHKIILRYVYTAHHPIPPSCMEYFLIPVRYIGSSGCMYF